MILCNGGPLYAPYSLLSISNMLCDASLLPWGGGGWGEQGGKVTLRPCFQGHKVTSSLCGMAVYFVLTRGDLQRRE